MIKTIGITATANACTLNEITPALNDLNEWGYKTIVSSNIGKKHLRFAGTDAERAAALTSQLLNPEIDAILCAKGGYGTIRILDLIDWQNMPQKPIIGYSDITSLLSHIHNLGWVGLHATMPSSWQHNSSQSSITLKQVLQGDALDYGFAASPFNKIGDVTAPIIGGNLSVLYSLQGSFSEMTFRGKILLLEEIDEYPYHIDRMLQALKRAGKLKNLAGVLIGGFTNLTPNPENPYGQNIEQIIANIFKDYDYPIVFNCPASHGKNNNLAIVLGKPAQLIVKKENTILKLPSLYQHNTLA